MLPLAPTHNVIKLFTDGEAAKHVLSCLQSSLPEVRVAAVTCAAHFLSNQALLGQLASSGAFLSAATQWSGALGNALMDPAPAVCGAAHAALQKILRSVANNSGSDTALLQDKLAGTLCQRVVRSLGSVLEQAQSLSAAEQVLVASSASATVVILPIVQSAIKRYSGCPLPATLCFLPC